MITRRCLLEMAGAGAALAGSGITFPRLLKAEVPVPNLPAGLPQGMRGAAVLDALPGKKPLIKLSYRPSDLVFPHADDSE